MNFVEPILGLCHIQAIHPEKAISLIVICQKILQWFVERHETQESQLAGLREKVRNPSVASSTISHSFQKGDDLDSANCGDGETGRKNEVRPRSSS